MFNNDNKRNAHKVQLLLTDGRAVDGTLMLPVSSDIRRVLNGDNPLLEFLREDRRESLIAKAAIVEIVISEKVASRAAA